MSNATYGTQQSSTPVTQEFEDLYLTTGANTYYPGAMIGLLATGYAAKFDDTQPMLFRGIVANSARISLDGSESLGDYSTLVKVEYPGNRFGISIAAASLADIGRLVYAAFDNQGSFTPGVNGNVIGRMVNWLSNTIIEVQPVRLANRCNGAANILPATGAVTLSKFDLNTSIFLVNTQNQTVTLPAVANTQAGDFLEFIKTNADSHTVTITGNASENINGANTYTSINAQYVSARLVSDGTQWIVASTKP